MSVILPSNPQNFGPVSTFNIIKAIEALGGSRGYLEHLKTAQSGGQIAQPLSLLSVSSALGSDKCPREHHNCSIRLQAGTIPGILLGEITVHAPKDDIGTRPTHFARITAWLTEGYGSTDLYGTVVIKDWEELCKAPTKFTIFATADLGVHATFSRDCERVADISAYFPEACGVQQGTYIGEGECKWETIDYF